MKRLIIFLFLFCASLAQAQVTSSTANRLRPATFANLGGPINGSVRYCSNCNANTSPCTSGGTGAMAARINGSWVCSTASAVSAATPGGSDTQVQFNDSNAFGGDAGFTYNKTTGVLTLRGAATGFSFFDSDGTTLLGKFYKGGGGNLYTQLGYTEFGGSNTWGAAGDSVVINPFAHLIQMTSAGKFQWFDAADMAGAVDTGMGRAAAGVVEVNNGTAGQPGTLLLRAYTVATLPSSPVLGMLATVTDGDPALAWGATVINSGGGTTNYGVWYNGTNWTVYAK